MGDGCVQIIRRVVAKGEVHTMFLLLRPPSPPVFLRLVVYKRVSSNPGFK